MLEVKNISKSFANKKVLNDISFELRKGKIYGLLGNNGAGKTTLSKIIFKEYDFDSGQFIYQGVKAEKINYSTWYFFSENNELPKNIKVQTYLLVIKNLFKMNSLEFKKRVEEILNFINIKELFKNKISELSAGQQKLLSLFVCFLLKPKVIFFDEPTANLDIKNKKVIIESIKRLIRSDTTIVLITHLIEEVRDILDHVIIIDQGVITYNQELKPNDNIKDIFYKFTSEDIKDTKGIEDYLNEK